MKRGFGSDNHSGVHPRLLAALSAANVDHAPSYGTDPWSDQALTHFRQHFGDQAQTFFVFNGTAANLLSLRAAARTFQSCYCTDIAHINVDECGAPEVIAGVKLLPLVSKNGKLSVEALKKAHTRRGDQHCSQAQIISLTQPTEIGTCYTVSELTEIIAWAKSEKLFVHIDGARLANAVVTLKTSFKALTTDLGVDIVSLGGTKNGLMMGEAVIFLNSDLARDFKYHRKQMGQLPSKTRFIAAQFSEYLGTNLWHEIATHSCLMAAALAERVAPLDQVIMTQPQESNAVFATIPQSWVKPLREKFFFYVWNEHTFECRWMTSWDTTLADVEDFSNCLKELSR